MQNDWTVAQGALIPVIPLHTWILISHYSAPSDSLFLGFTRRKDARTVNWIGLMSKLFDLLPQFKDGKCLNWSPMCFHSNHNLPEFWNPVAALLLIHCSYNYLEEGWTVNKFGLLTIRAKKNFDFLSYLKDLNGFNSQLSWIFIWGCSFPY